MAVKKEKGEAVKNLVIQNYTVAQPVRRTKFDIADWRRALEHAEADNGNRVELYDLYADILLDPHLSSQWQKRISNITNTTWQSLINKVPVEAMTKLCNSPQMEEVLNEVMDTQAFGKTVLELGNKKVVVFGVEETKLEVYSVKRQHIRPKEGVVVKRQHDSAQNSTTAVKYKEPPLTNYVADIGKDDDLGLLLKAAPYVLLKRGNVGDWAQFVQLFGMPFREYRYDGYDEATYEILKKNAETSGSAPYIILPDGAQVVIHDNKIGGTGAGDVFEKLANFCDMQISILILGNTETTKSSASSGYAQSETHYKTQLEVYRDDIKYVTNWLNEAIAPILYNLGYPVAGSLFAAAKEANLTEAKDKLTIVEQIKRIGEPVDADYVYEVSGVPKPQNYDALKAETDAAKAAEEAEKVKVKKETKKLIDNLDWFDKFRIKLADFFDQAHW